MSVVIPEAARTYPPADAIALADPAEQEPEQHPAGWPLPVIGDPSLGGDGIRVAVDADCPACGWPERFFDTMSRRFGCIQCGHTSDERNG